MALEKIYGEFMELYDSSGREFFSEAVVLLANWYTGREHTILARDGECGWKLAASTLRNPDETDFLVKAAGKDFKECERGLFFFSAVRNSVCSHRVIPLMVRKGETAGLWIMESIGKEKISPDREILKTGHLLAFFVQHSLDERMLVYNKYLDAEMNLPGKTYFRQVTGRIQEQGHLMIVCGFRWNQFREAVRAKGAQRMEEEMLRLCEKIKRLDLGNVYSLEEDTIVLVSADSSQEVYAGVDCTFRDQGMGKALKIVILCLARGKDVLTELESAFQAGRAGNIWIQTEEKKNPVSRRGSEKQAAEEAQEQRADVPAKNMGRTGNICDEGSAEEIEDILGLLEGRGSK